YGPSEYYHHPMPYCPPQGYYPVSFGGFEFGDGYKMSQYYGQQPLMLPGYHSQSLPPYISQQQSTLVASSNNGYQKPY
ncbi:MAG TPA: hypothetical protein PLD88_08640, partial [Candidatus Berkiella sp.]|nr:hypothetical protein [Candidatus Berkiella sp.]